MRLTRIKLFNYRCFGPAEQVIVIDDLTIFIGNNNSGKTATLSALNCMFSENSNDRLLQRSDFHLPKDMNPESLEKQSLYIETVFEFDELNDENQYGGYSVPQYFQHLVVDEPEGTPYLRIRMDATWEKSSTIEGSIDSQIKFIICPEKVEIKDESRVTAYRRDLDRIRVEYIPAVREPAKQLRNISGTMMYQIISNINWSDTTKANIITKIQELNTQFEKEKGVSMFGSSIAKQWKKYDSDERYSTASLKFNSTDIATSIKKTEVVFQPTVTGKEYTIDQMGDGLRSLFYVSLVDSILDVEDQIQQEIESDSEHTSFNRNPPILTIVALEEPENHIAPHLLGRLMGNLHSIAKKRNAQVIMSSHSPAIVGRANPDQLRYFRLSLSDAITQVRCITLPDKERVVDQHKYIKEAVKSYPELYFAKLIILGEGDSEEIILPKFWEIICGNADISGISIVPLGGRHVNHFWRLLNDLQIPHITLLDLDREREGGGWARIKYALKQLLINGYDREPLLSTASGVLTEEALDKMDEWGDSNTAEMEAWIARLEQYHVFFSAPLDIDFLMLEHYANEYQLTLGEKEGPRINITNGASTEQVYIRDIETERRECPGYDERIIKDVELTLNKQDGCCGSTYSSAQQRLMGWYVYFFLNRGKPSTHIAALSTIDKETLKNSIPPVLKRLITMAGRKLKDETHDDNPT